MWFLPRSFPRCGSDGRVNRNERLGFRRGKVRSRTEKGRRGREGSRAAETGFLTAAAQPFPSFPNSERVLHRAGVEALPDGRPPTHPGIGPAGAGLTPSLRSGWRRGASGQVLGRWTLCAGRSRLGSEEDSLWVGEEGLGECQHVGGVQLIGRGWPLVLRAVCTGSWGGEGNAAIYVGLCVVRIYGGGELWGCATIWGSGLGDVGSVYEPLAYINGSRCREILVSRCFEVWIRRGLCACV